MEPLALEPPALRARRRSGGRLLGHAGVSGHGGRRDKEARENETDQTG